MLDEKRNALQSLSGRETALHLLFHNGFHIPAPTSQTRLQSSYQEVVNSYTLRHTLQRPADTEKASNRMKLGGLSCGEFKGTSRIVLGCRPLQTVLAAEYATSKQNKITTRGSPLSARALPTCAASVGATPRRIATSGQDCSAAV